MREFFFFLLFGFYDQHSRDRSVRRVQINPTNVARVSLTYSIYIIIIYIIGSVRTHVILLHIIEVHINALRRDIYILFFYFPYHKSNTVEPLVTFAICGRHKSRRTTTTILSYYKTRRTPHLLPQRRYSNIRIKIICLIYYHI